MSRSAEGREERIEAAASTKRRVAPLFAKRKQAINDDHVEDFDKTDDDGHKIREITTRGVDGTSKTLEIDQTALLTPGKSTTSNMEIIRIEAELAGEGREVKNCHIPANDGVLDRALDMLDEHDLTPAWEVSR